MADGKKVRFRIRDRVYYLGEYDLTKLTKQIDEALILSRGSASTHGTVARIAAHMFGGAISVDEDVWEAIGQIGTHYYLRSSYDSSLIRIEASADVGVGCSDDTLFIDFSESDVLRCVGQHWRLSVFDLYGKCSELVVSAEEMMWILGSFDVSATAHSAQHDMRLSRCKFEFFNVAEKESSNDAKNECGGERE